MLLKESHLPIKEGIKITKNNINSYAHPLNEIKFSLTLFDKNISKIQRVNLINNVVNFLDVENSLRYKPKEKSYCNVYASDLIKLVGGYLPRVWWTENAISELYRGENLSCIYDKTVEELNTNMMFEWLQKFGDQYSWNEVPNYKELKKKVRKNGTVGIVVNKRQAKSGHISIVYRKKRIERLFDLFHRVGQTDAGRICHRFFLERWWEENNSATSFFYLNI